MPLLSLINDQLVYLNSIGVQSIQIKGNTEIEESTDTYNSLKELKYKIAFVTPEKLARSP